MAGQYPSYSKALEQFDSDGDGVLSKEEFYEKRQSRLEEYDFSQNGSIEKDEWDFFVARMATRPGFFAIRLGGLGDVSATHVDWVVNRPLGNVPTPADLRRRDLLGSQRGNSHKHRCSDRRDPQARTPTGRTRRLLRVAGGRGRQALFFSTRRAH